MKKYFFAGFLTPCALLFLVLGFIKVSSWIENKKIVRQQIAQQGLSDQTAFPTLLRYQKLISSDLLSNKTMRKGVIEDFEKIHQLKSFMLVDSMI